MVKLHSISIYAMQYDDIHELIESEDVERSRNEANWQDALPGVRAATKAPYDGSYV